MDQVPAGQAPELFRDGGEMGRRIRAFDWSRTRLGPAGTWPPSLRIAVSILLKAPVAQILLWGPDGIMLYNDAYAQIAGGKHPAILGAKVLEGWPEVADFNAEVLRTCLAGDTLVFSDQEMTLYRHSRPEQVWLDLYYGPVDDDTGRPGGVLATVIETTQRVQAQRRIAAEDKRLREMFRQAPGFMALLTEADHRFEIANDSYMKLVGPRPDPIGMPVREALPEVAGQGYFEMLDRVRAEGRPFVGRSLPVSLQREAEAPAERRFVDLVAQPLRDSSGDIFGIFLQGHDVTERVAAEEQQRLLLRELNHRVKNLFAIVGGMISLTARSAGTVRDMAVILSGRLNALARANDLIRPGLLGEGVPTDATLGALLQAVLLPHRDEAFLGRIRMDGPEVKLGARAVTALALVLHEAATNAAKYGALSVPEGTLAVEWTESDGGIVLVWQERGGPRIDGPPTQLGFGSLLASRSVEGQLGGRLSRFWEPDGLIIQIDLPREPLAL